MYKYVYSHAHIVQMGIFTIKRLSWSVRFTKREKVSTNNHLSQTYLPGVQDLFQGARDRVILLPYLRLFSLPPRISEQVFFY